MLALGRHLHDAGEKQRLTDLLGDRVESLPAGAARVTAYLLLTEGHLEQGSADIVALLEKALAEAGDDPVLRGQVLSYIAENDAVVEVREVARADERATEAVALSKQGSPDDQRLALNTLTWTQALRGRPVAHLVDGYYSLSTERAFMARHPERIAGQRLFWRGELDLARPMLTTFFDDAEEWAEAYALARLHLCEMELRAGRWNEVERMLDDWAASTDSALLIWPMFERCRGLLAAGRGDVEAARRWAGRAVELAESTGVRWDWLEATRALGVAALLAKDLPEAVARLSAVWEHTLREGVLDPGAFPAGPDLVEALAESERYDEAQAVVDVLADRASDQGHPWAWAGAQRGAALIEIHGDAYTDSAGATLEAAAASYRDLGLAFDEARTLLLARPRPAPGQEVGRRTRRAGARGRRLRGDRLARMGRRRPRRARARRRPQVRHVGRAHRDRTPRGRPRRRRPGQQGDRADPGRHREHRRVPPPQHLRQARHPFPRAARRPRCRGSTTRLPLVELATLGNPGRSLGP